MERSANRTRMSQRSKGACTIAALAVGFGCAVFGVGGAAGGDRSYVHQVREARLEARLAGIALAHRSPEQVVLAMRPEHHAVSSAHEAAVTPVSSVSAASTTTTAAATTTTPATTTTSTTTTPDPSDTATTTTDTTATDPTTTGTTTTGTTTTGTTTTGTGTTATDPTTTGTTTTGATTTGTSTTGTGTTTTGTTTTGTSTNLATTSTTTTGNDATTALVNGRQPGTTNTTTTSLCHGRCVGSGSSSSVTQAAVPSTTSASSSGNFTVTPATVTPASVAPLALTTPVNDTSSSTGLTPVATTPTTTPAPAPTPTPTPTSSGNQSTGGFSLNIHFPNLSSALKNLPHGSGGSSHRSTAGVITATGTGALASRTGTGGAPTGTTGTGTAGGTGAAKAGTHTPAHRGTKRPSPNDGSGIGGSINQSAKEIVRFVNVIPTAVWIALGAAFGLMLAFAAVAFRSSRRARRRENEFAAISAAALTDALTGILNRRGFTEAAERELARASRYERPFVLAYVDVRGLKSVNDTEGHLVGDELIKTVADLMKESARADDVVGRIGGDEFALLLGEQTAESAAPVFRRIGARVEEARAGMEISVPWELTIGMASFPEDGTTLEELLEVSDRRLYEQRGIALR
jgi:diguanylate cyclase (GGDEF)-like protein